jgi:hypothetical protein
VPNSPGGFLSKPTGMWEGPLIPKKEADIMEGTAQDRAQVTYHNVPVALELLCPGYGP